MLISRNRIILSVLVFVFLLAAGANPAISAEQNGGLIKIRTVVIDAGHGGNDPGAINRARKLKEKDITLSVALKLGGLIKEKYPDIKVIYTRSTDKFVELNTRTDIANRNNADLFISIHVNSAKSTSARGTETWVMGAERTASNLEVCKTENSVITLEEDYSSKYEKFDPDNPESYIIFSLLQNTHLEQSLLLSELVQKNMQAGPIVKSRGVKQGPFLVLWKATMPSILVELGFISNETDSRLLGNKYNHITFAKRIFAAFEEYKKQYEKNSPACTGPSPENSESGEYFAVQLFAIRKVLDANAPELKNLRAEYFPEGNLYKYVTGKYGSETEAAAGLKEIRRKFPDAFIVKVRNGRIVK